MEDDSLKQLLERGKQQTVSSFEQAISSGRKININIEQTIGNMKPQVGDSIIRASSILALVREYSKRGNFPQPTFGYSTDNTINAEMYPLCFLNSIKDYEKTYQFTSAITETTQNMADTLKLPTPQSLYPLEQVPGHPYLNDFDRENVEKRKKQVKDAHPGKTIVIAQTGSDPIKRWTNKHMESLAELAKQNADHVIILSDAGLNGDDTDNHPLHKYSQADTKINTVFITNIEDLAVYTGTADVFISTDSAPAWVWGCEKKDGSRALIQHVVATDYWQVPGAEIIESKAISKAKGEGAIDSHGMLKGNSDDDRRRLYNALSDKEASNTEMSEQDFQDYYNKAHQLLVG